MCVGGCAPSCPRRGRLRQSCPMLGYHHAATPRSRVALRRGISASHHTLCGACGATCLEEDLDQLLEDWQQACACGVGGQRGEGQPSQGCGGVGWGKLMRSGAANQWGTGREVAAPRAPPEARSVHVPPACLASRSHVRHTEWCPGAMHGCTAARRSRTRVVHADAALQQRQHAHDGRQRAVRLGQALHGVVEDLQARGMGSPGKGGGWGRREGGGGRAEGPGGRGAGVGCVCGGGREGAGPLWCVRNSGSCGRLQCPRSCRSI